jgi:hypothetical protein
MAPPWGKSLPPLFHDDGEAEGVNQRAAGSADFHRGGSGDDLGDGNRSALAVVFVAAVNGGDGMSSDGEGTGLQGGSTTGDGGWRTERDGAVIEGDGASGVGGYRGKGCGEGDNGAGSCLDVAG